MTLPKAILNETVGDPWMDAKLKLRKELKFDIRHGASETNIVIEDPIRSKFYQVGKSEYLFIAMLDGSQSPREIVANWSGSQSMTEEMATEICRWLHQSNLVSAPELDNTKRLGQQMDMARKQQIIGWLNPISFKLKLFNPNQMLARLQPGLSWVFGWPFFLVWLIVAGVAASTVWHSWEQLGDASVGILADGRWIWLLLVWSGLKIVHEMAHGIACRKYGGEVNEAGILFLLFTPLAFVNVTSSWRFSNRWHRIVVAGAGMYVELFISFLAVIFWARSDPGLFADICFNVFFMSSVTTVLFNANPLMRFDGYYILTDTIRVPNLYTKGAKWFSDQIKTRFFGVPKTANICLPHERWMVMTYGTLAFFWKILISFSLIIGASVLFYGAGKILAIAGVLIWFGLPIWNQLKLIFGPNAQYQVSLPRVLMNGAIAAGIMITLMFGLSAPATKSAPLIVQFKDETTIRAETDGFIQQIYVRDGDSVVAGQILVQLRNPQLNVEIVELESRVEAAKVESRIHRQGGDIDLAQAAEESCRGFRKQLFEKRRQLKLLTVRAPHDGFVFERNLDSKAGGFARQGDLLLTTAQKQTKEIVVAVNQQDWDSMKGKVGSSMRVVLPKMPVFSTRVSHIAGRATDIPSHPSLCASAGGPLAIRMTTENEETQQKLLSPHFSVDLELDSETSKQLRSGQRGRAVFETAEQSLGGYLFVAAEQWLQNKVELATQSAIF